MPKQARVFIILLTLFCSFCISTLYIKQNNTLSKVQNWRSLKMELQKTVMASFSFYATRKALAGGKLDLGTWHGFNEVVSLREFAAAEVTFDFYLKDTQYLSFHYNRSANSFDGFTISANSFVNSKYFSGDSFGKFSTATNIDVPNLKKNSWNSALIRFGQNKSELFINSKLVNSNLPAARPKQSIGFKGSGHEGSSVDNVVVRMMDGVVWKESFDNSENFYLTFLVVSAVSLFVVFAIATIFKSTPNFSLILLSSLFVLSFLLPILLWVDSYVTNRYYFANPSYLDFLQRSVKKEFEAFVPADQSPQTVANEFSELYNAADAPPYKIVILGTSQTWGSGASSLDRTIANQYNLSLEASGLTKKARAYGLAVPGSYLTEMSALFYELTKKNRPNLVIINMCINDTSDLVAYEKNLKVFIPELKKMGVQVIISAEPFYDENQTISRHNHEVVQKVSVDTNIPFINEQDYLFSKLNSGYLWWDVVHMSDYGQQLFGTALFEKTKAYIK
jgi:lysophospholipase L1-like esterase